MTKKRKEIRELRDTISRRTSLYLARHGSDVGISDRWTPFQGGVGDARVIPSLSSSDRTVVLFRAPKGSSFDLHRHRESETCVAVTQPKDDQPAVEMEVDDEVVQLSCGDAVEIPPYRWHSAVFLRDATLILQFTPSLPQTKSGLYVWTAIPESNNGTR